MGARLRPVAEQGPDRGHTSLVQLLNDVHRRMAIRVAAAVGGSARLDEWAVLAVLADGVGHPMSEVAELTHTLPSTMTKLADRMVASGLVHRRTDPLDRRRVLAFSTALGRRRYRRLQSLVDAAVADLCDDDQLRELVGELHRRVVPNPGPRPA